MFKKLLLSCSLALSAILPGFCYAEDISICAVNAQGLEICDVSFIGIPAFNPIMTTFALQTGIYTVRNNTRAPIRLNGIRLVRLPGDTLPAASSFIDPTVPNACGAAIAPYATCNIRVALFPTVVGTFNRVLRIDINTRQCNLTSPAIVSTVTAIPLPPIPDLPATFFSCLITGTAAVGNGGASIVNGGVCSSANVVGFPPGVALSIHEGDAIAAADIASITAANTFLRSLCPVFPAPQPTLEGVFTPGVYCLGGSPELTNLVLSGAGNYFFITEAGFSTAPNSAITLINGATPGNVVLSTSGQTTIGDNTLLNGTLIAEQASLNIGSGVVVRGAIKSLGASITINQIVASAP
ncbi:ice-binding family protein [Legionella gresilensis]|uniref:ice-binding family protein n=1 Tax=Legionella gresilensis TaxID=91823 RepID=UPI001040E541|nr:ice-binding family protein [Legionella gresilensis]